MVDFSSVTQNAKAAATAGLPGLMAGITSPAVSAINTGSVSITDTLLGTNSLNPVEVALSSVVDNQVMPTENRDGGNHRLGVILPRSAAASISGGKLNQVSNDLSQRGAVAAIRLLANPNVQRQTNVAGIDISPELAILSSQVLAFNNFLLCSVDTSFSEKVQIQTTFGDGEVVYYFGHEPTIFNLRGMLVDSIESDWFGKFIVLYQTTLRGSKLAQNYELVEIILPNMKIVGSIMNLAYSQDAARDTDIPFSMQILAKSFVPMPVPQGVDAIRKLQESTTGNMLSFQTVVNRGASVTTILHSLVSNGSSSGQPAALNGLVNLASITNAGSFLSSISSTFSPVYGVLADITKKISSTGGDVSSLLNQFTSPVNAILGNVTSIASQAAGVANLIDSTVNGVVNIPGRTLGNLNSTLSTLKNAVGVIARTPETITQSMARLNRSAKLNGSAAILGGGNHSNAASKMPLLNSGSVYTPTAGYKL